MEKREKEWAGEVLEKEMDRVWEEGVGVAYQVMTLSAIGEAETPAGGSVCMRCGTMRGQWGSTQNRQIC